MKSGQTTTLIELLRKYNPATFPVGDTGLDSFQDIPQDANLRMPQATKKNLAEGKRCPDEITNVQQRHGLDRCRAASPFRYFLDGCRRAYYLCDMATASGTVVPILAGQISSAVVQRDKGTGRVSLYRHERRSLLLLPTGGHGLNREDTDEICRIIDQSFSNVRISAKCIEVRHQDKPQDDALAHINMEMQALEIMFLEEMATSREICDDSMIVVDGALQFQRPSDPHRAFLRYAIGVSKRFNLHLCNLIARNKEIGPHLLGLHNVGDRTTAFRLKDDRSKVDYAFWYMRIHPREKMRFPFAGIVKIEKALVDPQEREDGLASDVVDFISSYVLLERTVCPYGLDSRWASHLYPIYLTEQVQKRKFVSDHFFRTLLKRKVEP